MYPIYPLHILGMTLLPIHRVNQSTAITIWEYYPWCYSHQSLAVTCKPAKLPFCIPEQGVSQINR